jgi:hypothetical protein
MSGPLHDQAQNLVQVSQQVLHAGAKAAPALAPGFATVLAKYLGIINTAASVTFLFLSIAFLLWRWRVAYKAEAKREAMGG